MINTYPFTSTDQDVDYNLVITHNLDTTNILPAWTDEDGTYQLLAGLCHFGDVDGNDQNNKITFMIGSAVTGTNNILLQYLSANESLATKKPLEQSETSIEPEDDDRFILGKQGKSVYNMTWLFMKNLLSSTIGGNFFSVQDSPFSEIALDETRKSNARSNLGVISSSNIDAIYLKKTDRLGTGQVLGTTNTSSYTPTSNYHPSTKKYVDDSLLKAYITLDESGKDGGVTGLTINQAFKTANIVNVNLSIEYTGATNSEKNICVLPVGSRPLSTCYFPMTISTTTDYQSGYIAVYSNGLVKASFGESGKTNYTNIIFVI